MMKGHFYLFCEQIISHVPNSFAAYVGVTRKRPHTMLMLVMKMQRGANISMRRLGAQKPGKVVSSILLAPALQMSKTLRARMWEKMHGGRNHNKAGTRCRKNWKKLARMKSCRSGKS